MASIYINALLQACLEVAVQAPRSFSSIAATSSTIACLSSWIVMICLRYTRSFRNPHRKKSCTVRSGDRAGQAMSPKWEITVLNIVARSNDPLRLTIRNGVLSSTVPLPANHNKLSRWRNIQIWNVSVGSAPPSTMHILTVTTSSNKHA